MEYSSHALGGVSSTHAVLLDRDQKLFVSSTPLL
ncbi:hypothetical protein E2C01_035435 [Portunus trituberculatus]|uniref:Uncharacterized protein n=1 Tax=Portunus trituberculatus TaxID=210409 RepID=A0A5B7F9R7_PORTR|nr:hypothetical protein [Portunus trituberculatus]